MWNLTSTAAGLSTRSPTLRGSRETFPRQRHTWSVRSCSQGHVAWCAGDSWFQLTVPWAGHRGALQKHAEALRPVAGKHSPASQGHSFQATSRVTKRCPRVQTTRVMSPSREGWQRMNAKLFCGRLKSLSRV